MKLFYRCIICLTSRQKVTTKVILGKKLMVVICHANIRHFPLKTLKISYLNEVLIDLYFLIKKTFRLTYLHGLTVCLSVCLIVPVGTIHTCFAIATRTQAPTRLEHCQYS